MGSGASAQQQIQQHEQHGLAIQEQEEKFDKKHVELSERHSDLEAKLTRHVTELNSKLREAVKAEGNRIEALIESRGKRCDEALTSYAQAQGRELLELQKALAEQLEDAMTRLDAVEPQLATFRQELDQLAVTSARMPQDMREEFQADLQKASSAQEKKASDLEARLKEQTQYAKTLRTDLDEALERCQSLQADITKIQREQEAARTAALKAQQDIEAQQVDLELKVEQRQTRRQDEVRQEVQRNIDAMEEQRLLQLSQMNDVANSIHVNHEAIRSARAVAESVHTRSLSWRLRGFHKRLAALLTTSEDVCIQSPGFHLSALPEMRLELQMGGRDSQGGADAPVPLPSVPVPVPGSATIRLWAPAGCHLSFRITVGEGANPVAKRFDHTFRNEVSPGLPDEQGRVCFAIQNFCQLDHVWTRSTDSIMVLFDLLEFRCAPASVETDAEATRRPASHTSMSEEGSEVSPVAISQDTTGGSDLDEVSYVRSGISEILLEERIRNEIQAVRNRSVRRVEWRVEGAQRMLEVCKVGESVESPAFCAAGLERLVFQFYPKGYDLNSTSGAMSPCALFVSGPVKTTLRGLLWVGSLNRQIDHRFRCRGDTGGRSKFGPLENQIDCNDSILIALDIHEVEVDLPEAGGSLVLREASSPPGEKVAARPPSSPATRGDRGAGTRAQGETSPGTRAQGNRNPSRGDAAPLVSSKGTLRVKREDPTKTEELVRCVSLPTLNARQMHAFKGRKGAFGG